METVAKRSFPSIPVTRLLVLYVTVDVSKACWLEKHHHVQLYISSSSRIDSPPAQVPMQSPPSDVTFPPYPGAALPIAIPKDIPIVAPMKTSIVWVSYRQNSVEDNERNNSNDSIFFYSTYLSFLCLHIISFINSLGNVNKIMLHRFICFFGSLNILCANSKCHFIIHCGARLVSVPL